MRLAANGVEGRRCRATRTFDPPAGGKQPLPSLPDGPPAPAPGPSARLDQGFVGLIQPDWIRPRGSTCLPSARRGSRPVSITSVPGCAAWSGAASGSSRAAPGTAGAAVRCLGRGVRAWWCCALAGGLRATPRTGSAGCDPCLAKAHPMETMAQPREPQPSREPLEVRVRAAPAGAVGQLLAQLRQDQGLTVDALARSSGVAARVILALERGTCRYPGGTSLLALAAAVGVDADQLLRGEDGRGATQASNRDRRTAGTHGSVVGRGRPGRDAGRPRAEQASTPDRATPRGGSNRRRGGKRSGGSAPRTRTAGP